MGVVYVARDPGRALLVALAMEEDRMTTTTKTMMMTMTGQLPGVGS